jgi:very-short-patch-repair endonuclease
MSNKLWVGRRLIDATSRETVRWRIARGELTRPTRGIYATGPVDADERLQALFMRLPPEAVLARQSAAHRLGFEPFAPRARQVMLPPGISRPRMPGVVVYEAVVAIQEPVVVRGIPCAPPARCAIDLARTLHRFEALPVLDAVLHAGLATLEDLLAEVDRHHGLRGVCGARRLLALADGLAECRQESQLRLVLIDGRLPRPQPQLWVRDADGLPRFRLDLGYEERKVGIEYDGVSHVDRNRLRYDRERGNWLAGRGWTMRHFTDRDLYHRPLQIVDSVRAALQAARPAV